MYVLAALVYLFFHHQIVVYKKEKILFSSHSLIEYIEMDIGGGGGGEKYVIFSSSNLFLHRFFS